MDYTALEIANHTHSAILRGDMKRASSLMSHLIHTIENEPKQKVELAMPLNINELLKSLDWAEVADRIAELEKELELLKAIEPFLDRGKSVVAHNNGRKQLKTRVKERLETNGPTHIETMAGAEDATIGDITHVVNRSNGRIALDAGVLYLDTQRRTK